MMFDYFSTTTWFAILTGGSNQVQGYFSLLIFIILRVQDQKLYYWFSWLRSILEVLVRGHVCISPCVRVRMRVLACVYCVSEHACVQVLCILFRLLNVTENFHGRVLIFYIFYLNLRFLHFSSYLSISPLIRVDFDMLNVELAQ